VIACHGRERKEQNKNKKEKLLIFMKVNSRRQNLRKRKERAGEKS